MKRTLLSLILCVITAFGAMASDVVIANLRYYYAPGEPLQYGYEVSGNEAVKSFMVDIMLDGNVIKTDRGSEVVATGKQYTNSIILDETLAVGNHVLSAKLKSVDGVTVSDEEPIARTFIYYKASDVVARQKYLVEEFTSNTCTYCPQGAQVMEQMLKKSDKIALVCIHGNMQGIDPTTIEDGDYLAAYLGQKSWPVASFDRIFISDVGLCANIAYEEYLQSDAADQFISLLDNYSEPSFIGVDITASVEDNNLNIRVSGRGTVDSKTLLEDYNLTVYVLENGLVYRQLNLGEWESDYMHNRVLRKVVTPVTGDEIKWVNDSRYSNEYVVPIEAGWTKEYLHVVAFISKKQNERHPDRELMSVNNANTLKVFPDIKDPQPEYKPKPQEPMISEGKGLCSPINTSSQMMLEGLSPNGKYGVGINYATYAPVIWDAEKDEYKNYALYERSVFHNVNNNGIVAGSLSKETEDNVFPCMVDANGRLVQLDTNGRNGDAYAVAADGTIGGYHFTTSGNVFITTPCIWKDGVRTDLAIPTVKEVGIPVDGAEIRWMSADANVLLGMVIDTYGEWPAVLWYKNSQGQYEIDPIFLPYWAEEYTGGNKYFSFSPGGISQSGEWVALSVLPEFDESKLNAFPVGRVARYSTKTKTLEVCDSYRGMSVQATGIADDGTIVATASPSGVSASFNGREAVIFPAGSKQGQSINDAIGDPTAFGQASGVTGAAISADASKVLGFGATPNRDFFSFLVYLSNGDGIESIYAEKPVVKATDRIYSISGQQVNGVKKGGLYIVNGKKYLVK